MIPSILTTTTEQHLTSLITAEVREGKGIEYKREIAVGSTDQKRKFIRSIASFANASGGDMVFGIEAKDGRPLSIRPLADSEPDAGALGLRDMIRIHIDPPLFGVEFQPVKVSGGWALVVRVPRSWNPPHMVTFDGDDRFYTRDASGCVRMNFPEIKEAFGASKALKDRIQQYRFQRLSQIRSGEMPWNLPSVAKSVFHVLPFRSLAEDHRADLSVLTDPELYPPGQWRSCGRDFDMDGIYRSETMQDGTCGNYTFVSRSGCIEGLTTANLVAYDGKWVANPEFEWQWVKYMERCHGILQKLGAEPPIALGLTLLDVAGFRLGSGMRSRLSALGARELRSRDLILPVSLLTIYQEPASDLLKPMFNSLWNSFGLQGSFNYDDAGKWAPRQWD